MTHLDTPYAVGPCEHGGDLLIWQTDEDDNVKRIIGIVLNTKPSRETYPETEATAEFIVRACNAHTDLVAALQVALTRLTFANKHINCEEEIATLSSVLEKEKS